MRILWICSFPPSIIAEEMGLEKNVFGGWINGTLDALLKTDNQIGIVFPIFNCQKSAFDKRIKNIVCYSIFLERGYDYYPSLNERFDEIIENFKPDVIHLWGCEFPFMKGVVNLNNRSKTVVSIQGLCGFYSQHYFSNLEHEEVIKASFRDIVRKDTYIMQKAKYIERGNVERDIIRGVDHCIGRTNWDYSCSKLINANIHYHFCNEILRPLFYESINTWKYDNCIKNSIFVSQSNYPIKGFHNVLKAVILLKKRFPNITVYTTGKNPYEIRWYKRTAYQNYLIRLMNKNGIKQNVFFAGFLDTEDMIKRYRLSNVFVSPSSIENSPNSVCEAMLIGVPTIASYVGGTMDLLEDKTEGFLYQSDAVYMLASLISNVFDGTFDREISKKSSIKAKTRHNVANNIASLCKIYEEICKKDE